MQKKEVKTIYGQFKQIYKEEFIKSNIIGWILLIVGIILYINYQAFQQLGDEIPLLFVFSFFLVLFFFNIILIWIFPLLAHYQTTIKQYFRYAIIIGLSKILYSIGICVSLIVVFYLSLEIPSMFIFVTFALISLLTMWFAMQVFNEIERKI